MDMAQPSGKLNFLSVTGYLELQQKGRFRTHSRRYWFWFDEHSCQLKYYRNQEAYTQCIHEPVGSIDLRYAKVTPGITTGTAATNEFYINANSQTFSLVAADSNSALDWIKKLQDKRGEWIKATSAKVDNSHEKRTLRPLNQTPVGILATSPDDQGNPSTVRKIVGSHIAPNLSLDIYSQSNPKDGRRRTSAASPSYSSKRATRLPLSKSLSADTEKVFLAPTWRGTASPEPPDLFELSPSSGEAMMPTLPLSKEERERLQLEHDYLESQGEVTRLQKDMMKMREKLERRDKEILELNADIASLKEELAKTKTPHNDLRLENDSLKNVIEQYRRSLCSLDNEVELHKLHQKEHDRRIRTERQRVIEMERELTVIKSKYIRLLSDKFKITLPNPAGPQELEQDPEEEKYNNELLLLLKQEGGDNPVFDSYKSKFEDQYGDLHEWQGDTTAHHYLCRQLYLHYTQLETQILVQEWEEYLSTAKKHRNTSYWELPVGNDRSKKREFRNMLRKGIPIQFRTNVWTSLVYRLVGRMREVRNQAAGKGNSYYQSLLLDSKSNSLSEKQIKLDLYRTLPCNRHFKMGGAGSPKLENVLLAYSLHNKNVGYCQGMNMLVAFGLLFLDEETAFWFLVAIIERILPAQYFTPGLLGAQADQAVVRDLLPDMLPRLSAHLQEYSIDVTLVTFNWFLTLFVDAMPTESTLRILDTFLFEGLKVLFRVSLGMLKINERRILSMTDPVSIFQFLKEIARHSFDVEELLNVSFKEINPFPSRSALRTQHEHHFAKLRTQWNVRERERELQAKNAKKEKKQQAQSQLTLLASSFAAREQQQTRRHLVWECGCVRMKGEGEGEVWLCCGERQQGRLGIVTVAGSLNMEIPETDVGSRVICIHHISSDITLLGTLDFIMHAIDCKTRKELWSVKLNDSILDLAATEDGTVFAALADGFVAVMQNVADTVPDSEPLLFRVGSTAVPCLALPPGPNQKLWCGCGRSITIMCASTFEPVQSLVMGDSAGKVYKMAVSHHGVWATFRSSSMVSLFDSEHYIKLLQLDYTNLLETPSPLTDIEVADHRITSLMCNSSYLWLGTGSGGVHIFSVVANVEDPLAKIQQLAKQSQESQEPSQQRKSYKSGGLLSKVVAEELTSLEPAEPIIETEAAASEDDAKFKARGGKYYERRRKTKFGRTLRHEFRGESSSEKRREPSIFQLVFEASNQVVPSKNESVRVLLPLLQGEDHFAVSCVHSLTEWERGVQVWRCQASNRPKSWTFGYLPSYGVFDSTERGDSPQVSSSDSHTDSHTDTQPSEQAAVREPSAEPREVTAL